MLISGLLDYSGGYTAVKRRISVIGNNVANRTNEKVTFQDNSLFRSCISKINKTLG